MNGAKRQNARNPTATAEWVSSITYQASAMFCIQVPTSEITWPVKNRPVVAVLAYAGERPGWKGEDGGGHSTSSTRAEQRLDGGVERLELLRR